MGRRSLMKLNPSWPEKYPSWEHLEWSDHTATVTLVESKTKLPTVKVGEYYLHSTYNPAMEAKRLAELHYKKNHIHILFGFGLGYLAKELFSKLGEKDYLLIIEPHWQTLRTALDTVDFEELTKSDRVVFHIGGNLAPLKEHLTLFIRDGFLGKTTIINSLNYDQLFPETSQEIAMLLKEISMIELINVNTLHFFAKTWQQNYILNLYQAVSAKPFSSLVNRLACPVIIAAAGPSLSKQLPLLRTVQSRAFILCAGSTINSLLAGGVTPHAIVTVDGGEPNYNHFKGLTIDHIPLIYSLTLHREIPCSHSGVHVVFNDMASKLASWTNLVLQRDIGLVKGGQSVANYCMDIACQITSGPICFVGQDLAYTGNTTHAEGNKHSTAISLEAVKNKKKYTMAQGYFGDQVLTDYAFLGMKKTFENYINFLRAKGDLRRLINATEGGIMIEGLHNMSFKDFIETHCRIDYRESIAELFEPDISEVPDWDLFYQAIAKERKNILRIIELCREAEKVLRRIKPGEKIDRSHLKKLDSIDNKLKGALRNDLMRFILQPVIFRVQYRYPEGENETAEELGRRVLAKSGDLYKEISESAVFTESCINRLIERINKNIVV